MVLPEIVNDPTHAFATFSERGIGAAPLRLHRGFSLAVRRRLRRECDDVV